MAVSQSVTAFTSQLSIACLFISVSASSGVFTVTTLYSFIVIPPNSDLSNGEAIITHTSKEINIMQKSTNMHKKSNNGKPYTSRGVSTVWGEDYVNLRQKWRKAAFSYSTISRWSTPSSPARCAWATWCRRAWSSPTARPAWAR